MLEVRVRDLSETAFHARGKQRLDRGTIWYTAQSGIWQTVWLETVPASYVERLVLTPHLDGGELEVTVVVSTGSTSGDDARTWWFRQSSTSGGRSTGVSRALPPGSPRADPAVATYAPGRPTTRTSTTSR